jgi:signal transduction histidine kinase
MYITDQQDMLIWHSSSGARQAKQVHKRENLFPINSIGFFPGEASTIYLRIRSATPLRIQLIFQSVNTYINAERRTNVFFGFYYGIIGLMILGLTYVLFVLRDRLYLYFLLVLATLTFNSLAMDNILPAWNFPGRPWLVLHLMTACIALTMFLYILFAESFFSLKANQFPGIRKFFAVLKILALITSIWYFAGFYSCNKYIYYLATGTMLGLLFISLYLWIRGMVLSRFFFWATFIPLAGSVILGLQTAGVFQSYLISQYGMSVGYLAQIIVFLAAVGDRYYILQKNFTGMLREKVKERTAELDNALKQLKSAQQQLVQSEKMASLGTLTAGISHEINNPLNYISGGLFLLDEHSEKKEDVFITEASYMDTALSMIREGFEKVHRIVTSLLSFSGRGEMKRDIYDIHKICDNTLFILRSRIPGDIELIRDYRLDKPVPVFQDKMHQIFLNIIDNAIFAMDIPGTLNGKKYLRITTRREGQDNGDFAVIEIFNTGRSIPDDHLDRIFDPFFTTREPGQGVGLGLSITYTLVMEHHGTIEARNIEGGVSFVIKLPLY